MQNTTDEDSMVVQHILCSRIGKREIKPTIPEVKAESSEEKNENTVSDTKDEEKEDESKEEVSEKESVSEATNKDEKDAEISEDKDTDDNDVKDKSKHEEAVVESKQESAVVDVKPQIVEVEEYFVKYRNFSYLHCEWRTEEELYKGDKRIQAKLKRFKQRQQQNTNIFENVTIDL